MFTFNAPLTNGQTVYPLAGAVIGNIQIVLSCEIYPSAGTATIEYKLCGGTKWRQVMDATAQPFNQELSFQVAGAVSALRLTLAGIVGGSGATLCALWNGSMAGISNVVTQRTFFEQGSLDGQVFELTTSYTLAAATNRDTIVLTGSKPVALITRGVQFDGAKLELHIYSAPTYTGGTLATTYGLNSISQNASTVQIYTGATVSATGTEISAPKYLLGLPPSGNKAVQSQTIPGESLRILSPNSTYLFRTANTSTDPMNITTYTAWHEGDL